MSTIEISQLENLCSEFYTASNELVINKQQRAKAGQTLQSYLESNKNFWSVFRILAVSGDTQLLFLSLSALTKNLPSEWKGLTLENKKTIYSNLLSLIMNSANMPNYLIGGVSKFLARFCRFSWAELEEIKQIFDTFKSILLSNPSLIYTVVKFYEELITEISEPVKGRSLTSSRKIATIFRDEGLGKIFTFALETLNTQLQSLSAASLSSLLTLLHLSLNFDFLGVSSDETCEDTICLQIPLSWKEHFENASFFNLLQFIILQSDGEIEKLALRVFNHVGAVRKSIFSGSIEVKMKYISQYLNVAKLFIEANKFESDSLFEFVSGLKRFFCNFGLKDLAESDGFSDWLQGLAKYSISLFSKEEAIASNVESSMIVWNYLAVECYSQGISSINKSIFTILFQAFLDCTLPNVRPEQFSQEKEGELKDQIETISSFAIHYYVEISKILENSFRALLSNCQFEKLTWVVLIASGFLGIRDNKSTEAHLAQDVALIQLVFESFNTVQNPDDSLQLSYVHFFLSLSKAYINSSYEKIWHILDPSTSSDIIVVQVLTPLLESCFKHLSSANNSRLLKSSLELFEVLCKGYYSNKYLIKNELIQSLMVQYKACPFCVRIPKFRKKLFNSLTHLWTNEELAIPIENFLSPLGETIQGILKSLNRTEAELVLNELTGICEALLGPKNYLEFFEWLYFRFSVVMMICETFLYDFELMGSLLGFLAELVNNRNNRIKFDLSTSYAIVLFKNVSTIIVAYGRVIADSCSNLEIFQKYSRQIKIIIEVLNSFLCGGFVYFGVFEVYNDSCFFDAVHMAFRLITLGNEGEILSFIKLLDVIFEFLELICKSHLKLLFTQLNKQFYSSIFVYLLIGVKSATMKHCVSAANSIGYLCEYIIKVSQKDFPEKLAVQTLVSEYVHLFRDLFVAVLEVIVLEDSSYMWSLSKPLLGLIIVNEDHFEEIKRGVVTKATLNIETQGKIYESISGLMNGVKRSMDMKNRDRFSKNFGTLRQALTALNN